MQGGHTVRRRVLAPLAAACALAAAAPAAAAAPPAVVLAYYEANDLSTLATAVERANLPAGTPVFYGSYYGMGLRKPGPKPPPGAPRPPSAGIAGATYAPIMSVQPSDYWTARSIPAAAEARLAATGQHAFAGRVPRRATLRDRPAATRVAWGRELGRRFRDKTRGRTRHGAPITTWQFDELPSAAVGPRGRFERDLIRGVLIGLHEGRPALGDEPQRGVVWATQTFMRRGGGMGAMWPTVAKTARLIVGEEYPEFRGSAATAAARQSGGRRALRRYGASGRALARRYVVGTTPGFRKYPGLGGNVLGWSFSRVESWRTGFLSRRARSRPAGFGAFHFVLDNRRAPVMDLTLRSLARAVRRTP